MEDARSACTGLCFLYNHREDRPDRALLFARHFFPFYKNHTVYLTGSGAALPKRLFARAGVTDLRVARDYRECLKQIPSGALLVGDRKYQGRRIPDDKRAGGTQSGDGRNCHRKRDGTMNDILLLGIILSLIYTEFTDLSPGGIIVPAYFAMYSYDWKRLAGTVLLALICVAVVHFLSKYMILYGRRRYAVYIMTGVLLKFLAGSLGAGAAVSIGNLIPGILGRDMERQHILPTLVSLGIVTLFTCIIFILVR